MNVGAILPLTSEKLKLTTTLEFGIKCNRAQTCPRGPIGSLKAFSKLTHVTVDVRLLLNGSKKLLSFTELLPLSIQALTIISPPPLSSHTRWEEQEQLPYYPHTLRASCTGLVKHITVLFDILDYYKCPYSKRYEKVFSTKCPWMSRTLRNRFAVLKNTKSHLIMNVSVTTMYGRMG